MPPLGTTLELVQENFVENRPDFSGKLFNDDDDDVIKLY
jgi:hypothetical protein